MIEQEGHVPDGEDVLAYEALHQEGFASHRFERGRRADQWKDSAASRHQTRVPGNASGRYERSETGVLAQGDDVLENVDEQTLETNADFVMELLKNV